MNRFKKINSSKNIMNQFFDDCKNYFQIPDFSFSDSFYLSFCILCSWKLNKNM